MNSELWNLQRRMWNPRFAARALAWGMAKAGNKLRKELMPWTDTPREIRKAARLINGVHLLDLSNFPDTIEFPLPPSNLVLATCTLDWRSESDWDTTFKDEEDFFVLHRWNWLLTTVSAERGKGADWGWGMTRSWLRKFLSCPGESMWESYSAGERIVNLLLYTRLATRQFELPPGLHAAIAREAYLLVSNLEYHGNATNNHAFNNGRALFFAGECLPQSNLSDLAYAIFKERLPYLITPDGFLCEGSSHYHLLFVRWISECEGLARICGNMRALEVLEPTRRLLSERLSFFLIPSGAPSKYELPLIGDVSPDFSPRWLLDDGRWQSLWKAGVSEDLDLIPGSLNFSRADGAQLFPASHWYRVDFAGWTWLAFIDDGTGCAACHSHADSLGFVLYWNGEPILIDSGRSTYSTSDPLGEHGLGPEAHNSVLIDGCECILNSRTVGLMLPDFYRRTCCNVDYRERGETALLRIGHDGLSRWVGSQFQHERRFAFSRDSFEVEDEIAGNRRLNITTSWHFSPHLTLENESSRNLRFRGWKRYCDMFIDATPSSSIHDRRLERGVLKPRPRGWYSPQYGVSCPAYQLTVEHRGLPPVTAKVRITMT